MGRRSHHRINLKSFLEYIAPLLVIAIISVFFALSSIINSERLENSNLQRRLRYLDNLAKLELQVDIAKALEAATSLSQNEALINWFTGNENPLYKELALKKLDNLLGDDRFEASFAAARHSEAFYMGSRRIENLSRKDPDDSWFYESLNMREKMVLNLDHNNELDKTLLWINAQVFHENDIVGIAGVGLSIEDLQERMKNLIPGKDSKILFIDDTGTVKLAYPFDMINRSLDDILKTYPGIELIDIAEDTTIPLHREDVIYTISGVPGIALTVVTIVPLTDIESLSQKSVRLYTLFSLLLVVLLVVFFLLIIHRLKTTLTQQTESQDMTILSMSMLSELKDQETGYHIIRTSHYCRLLAEELRRNFKYTHELNSLFMENIERLAPIHDIGKVGIPDRILLKEGKLSKEEFDVMKTHTTLGARVLQTAMEQLGNSPFLSFGIKLVLYHHEKWDGSGYPRGLAGEEIPLAARIMAVADVYDALRNKRHYKDAISHKETIQIITNGSGTHFQPELVEALIRIQDKFEMISIDLNDDQDLSR